MLSNIIFIGLIALVLHLLMETKRRWDRIRYVKIFF
jgi:hypothetical protein